jgi:hypothetical protein
LKIGILRLPVEFALDLVGAGDQDGGVAGAPSLFAGGDRMPGDFAYGVDDFADREARPVPDCR